MFEYLIAFGAGLISFLSPCVLPLIPGYISSISGQSLQEILNKKKINFFPLLLFCLGFSTVFVIFLYSLIDMRLLDAFNLAFTTISSGGFIPTDN